MHLVDGFDSVEMIYSRIHPDLIEYHNARFRCRCIEYTHSRRDVACGDDIDFVLDRRLDKFCMVHVWDEGDDEIVSRNGFVEVGVGRDIRRDGIGSRQAEHECLSGRQGATRYVDANQYVLDGKLMSMS
jgi:hypothetical protein